MVKSMWLKVVELMVGSFVRVEEWLYTCLLGGASCMAFEQA